MAFLMTLSDLEGRTRVAKYFRADICKKTLVPFD